MASLPAGVSFLVCTYNSASRIGETLACLARQEGVGAVAWEVILVDNACTDGTAQIARTNWDDLGAPVPLRIFQEPRPGKNYAVELAFNQVQYRYACIVDDDNRLAPDYLRTGYELLQTNPQIGLLGGQNTGTFDVPPPTWFSAFQVFYAIGEQRSHQDGSVLPTGNIGTNVLWGAGMFVRTELWRALRELKFQSLFSGRQGTKNLTAGEDDELCYVAQMLGYEVWYWPLLRLQHHMAAGRLTEEYRNRLFYGTVWSQARLKVYRDVLSSPAGKKPGSATNLLKDILYMSRTVAQRVLSVDYARALLHDDTLQVMGRHHQLLTLYDFMRNFRQIQRYYMLVEAFKQRASQYHAKLTV
ncbi:glycosyltransferase [Hymenobacter cavernae]|uniref:Glycosyltransferase 2-like domain-containing protein n=1 Tax=Hymenobacter cavernae TaxID=2044852 RepID=A0ABQ1UL55_9BACT|nr:glycosyltransferase [Hymenobacter cavernae]GGF20523.1 hypothetical protein GCM10011383_35200 [Hymenobacter cavernae]